MARKSLALLLAATLVALAALPSISQAAEQKKLKVAFALLWTIDDQGWTTAHYQGIEHLKQKLGDKIEISYTEKVRAPDAERVFRSYAQQGYDIIFGTTFEHMDPLLRVAKDFPDIKFEHCSGYKTAPNMGNYMGRMEQGEYLAGYMAGLMGFKNVGTVASQPIPEPIRGINAFTLGMLRGLGEAHHGHNPKAVNTVAWLNSWRDPINETTLAETLAARGHDLIRQMADTPDSALAACNAGKPAVGYGTDSSKFGASCTLVSTVWNWGPYYVKTVQSVLDGTWKPREYFGGFEDGIIGLSEFHSSVPAEVRRRVLAEKARMEKGRDNSFAGPIKDQSGKVVIPAGKKATDQELLTMQWFVEGVSGTIPK